MNNKIFLTNKIPTFQESTLFDNIKNPTKPHKGLKGYMYNCEPLKLGNCGKCILTYNPQTNIITFRISKNNLLINNLPKSIKNISIEDLNIKSDLYKYIFKENEIGLGGGFFAYLKQNKLAVGSMSIEYGAMHLDILRECLIPTGLELIFLKDIFFTQYSIEEYMAMKIKTNKRGEKQ